MKPLSVVLLAIALMAGLATPARAQTEVAYCWYERSGGFGRQATLVCRIAGSDTIIEYVIIDPPPTLWPDLGRDSIGECWFNRTVFSGWRIIAENADGEAYFWYSPDDTFSGPWIDVGWIRRCEDEPVEIVTIIDLLWEEIANFDFEEPEPELQPDAGVTGLPTYLDLDPPAPETRTIVSPVTGDVLEVEFVVAAVIIDWGDDDPEEITPSLYDLFGPYPDGQITHTYETKDNYTATVSYEWTVRWRFAGGPWQTINDIDPTTWTTAYQVDEIVTRVTG